MHTSSWTLALLGTAITARGASLPDVCTSSYAQAALPSDDYYIGITIDSSSVVATAVTNASVSGEVIYPDAVFSYCNVTFAYSHVGRNDQVLVTYWLPSPDNFENRFLSTGGGGFAINSGNSSLPRGIIYGAAAGLTDGGFGSFSTDFDAVFLLANGTVNWQNVFMFGYQGIHEMTGCSEGGREGFGQVQRYGTQFDGLVIGAPALRYGQQQVNHLTSNVVEQTLDYYPPTCEFEKIVNLTITACDPLDGKTDGVIARTDLCKLHFNLNSTIGAPYYCAATSGGSNFGKVKRQLNAAAAAPAQNGTVTAQGVAVAQTIMDGLRTLNGRQAYFSYQPGNSFADAQTAYNSTSDEWGFDVNTFGGEWVAKFFQFRNLTTLPNLNNVTYDTLRDWMEQGMQLYYDTLQTTWPDLTPFESSGAKVLTYHGESDNSIPTASSVRYWDSVRKIMYPNLNFNASTAKFSDWYRLYLVPGAAHCSTNTLQPNGPFPQTNLAVLINWVEKGTVPMTLNATVLQGEEKGQNRQICTWPLRPLWKAGVMECVFDKASINNWLYDLNAYKFPVY